MAVFTTVTEADARELLTRFSIGDFVALKPISSGIENTNYFLTTTQGEWVLTLFERLKPEELPFYLELCEHLLKKGCRVAAPVRTKDDTLFTLVHGKPASIANRLYGTSERRMGKAECRSMGELLAQMHLAVQDFPRFQENLRGLSWWKATVPGLEPYLPKALFEDLTSEVACFDDVSQRSPWKDLPRIACHCDLFRDNTLIENAGKPDARVAGVFDFYFAGCMPRLYDLAVVVNDWCVDDATGALQPELVKALMDAYHTVAPLTDDEKTLWRTALRAGATRFWISRLNDFYKPREASLLTPHDPTHFERVLHDRRTCALYWPD